MEELKIKVRENQQESKKIFNVKRLKYDIEDVLFIKNIKYICLKCIKSD